MEAQQTRTPSKTDLQRDTAEKAVETRSSPRSDSTGSAPEYDCLTDWIDERLGESAPVAVTLEVAVEYYRDFGQALATLLSNYRVAAIPNEDDETCLVLWPTPEEVGGVPTFALPEEEENVS